MRDFSEYNHDAGREVVKCVVVGDTNVGKTKLVCAQACGTQYTLPQLIRAAHVSTVWAIDHYKLDKEVLDKSRSTVDGVDVSLRLWDTFGYHDWDRQFAYGRADVVLVCFSLVKPNSLRNVTSVWFPEVANICPGTPIVLCGCQADLRYLYLQEDFLKLNKGQLFRTVRECDLLYPENGRSVAKKLSAPYYETSVLTRDGVNTVFENVIRVALRERRRHRFWATHLKSIQKPSGQPPLLPPCPSMPEVTIPDSPMCQDLSNLLETKLFCDVTFLVQGRTISAHSIILMSSCQVFWEIFHNSLKCNDEKQDWHSANMASDASQDHVSGSDETGLLEIDSEEILLSESPSNSRNEQQHHDLLTSVTDVFDSSPSSMLSNKMKACTSSYDRDKSCQKWQYLFAHVQVDDCKSSSDCDRTKITVTLDQSVCYDVFHSIIVYLYSGKLPHCEDALPEVMTLAHTLCIDTLVVMLTNLAAGEEFLNTETEEEFYKERQDCFVNSFLHPGLLADVIFKMDDGNVAAHKLLLVSRCEMMEAMFCDDFKESSAKMVPFPGVNSCTFVALLEYLYRGHCPSLAEVDVIELISLANRLCLTHLVALVESQVIKSMTCERDNGQDMTRDTLYLLESAQLHNAAYLATFCLHHLSMNYSPLSNSHSELLKCLSAENKHYLMVHRWPPLWYVREVAYFERQESVPEDLTQEKEEQEESSRHQEENIGCLCFMRCRRQKPRGDDNV